MVGSGADTARDGRLGEEADEDDRDEIHDSEEFVRVGVGVAIEDQDKTKAALLVKELGNGKIMLRFG